MSYSIISFIPLNTVEALRPSRERIKQPIIYNYEITPGDFDAIYQAEDAMDTHPPVFGADIRTIANLVTYDSKGIYVFHAPLHRSNRMVKFYPSQVSITSEMAKGMCGGLEYNLKTILPKEEVEKIGKYCCTIPPMGLYTFAHKKEPNPRSKRCGTRQGYLSSITHELVHNELFYGLEALDVKADFSTYTSDNLVNLGRTIAKEIRRKRMGTKSNNEELDEFDVLMEAYAIAVQLSICDKHFPQYGRSTKNSLNDELRLIVTSNETKIDLKSLHTFGLEAADEIGRQLLSAKNRNRQVQLIFGI